MIEKPVTIVFPEPDPKEDRAFCLLQRAMAEIVSEKFYKELIIKSERETHARGLHPVTALALLKAVDHTWITMNRH